MPAPITDLLVAWQNGDENAVSELMYFVNSDLRLMARRYLSREHKPDILQPTVLVNELFIHLMGRKTMSWKNRDQFFSYAAQKMQHMLVDHIRRQKRFKHGSGKTRESLGPEHELQIQHSASHEEILAIHEAVERLAELDETAATVVRLRYFVGMTVQETSGALERSPATIKRDWKFARRWLYKELRSTNISLEEDGDEATIPASTRD